MTEIRAFVSWAHAHRGVDPAEWSKQAFVFTAALR